MTYEDKKRYVSDLCVQLCGIKPKDVVPFQKMLHSNETSEGYFFVECITSGGNVTLNGRVSFGSDIIANNVCYISGNINYTAYGYESKVGVFGTFLSCSGSAANCAVCFSGWQCVF